MVRKRKYSSIIIEIFVITSGIRLEWADHVWGELTNITVRTVLMNNINRGKDHTVDRSSGG